MSLAALNQLRQLLGEEHVLTQIETTAGYLTDERRRYVGRALAVIRPGSRQQVADAIALCADVGLAIVPQGGNTGYCGGATPDVSGEQIVLSLERLNRVINIDQSGATLSLEAGVTLSDAQAAAEAAGLLLPLAMGSQDSCQIGGNLSTNAGGLAVLRYGTTRDLVLGLEVVLADGRVLSNLNGLRKDNTGYDLKQLFIGAEGTLGVITAAVLKLFPRPSGYRTVMLSIDALDSAITVLNGVRKRLGDSVTSCEYIRADAAELVRTHVAEIQLPFDSACKHYLLLEWPEYGDITGDSAGETRELEAIFGDALIAPHVQDAVVAVSETQRRALWRIRESVPLAEKNFGGSIKHDISVCLGDVDSYVQRTEAALLANWPTLRFSIYGHIGDGNVHFNVLAPNADVSTEFISRHSAAISEVVHQTACDMGGSFSAEHGVGKFKRDLLSRYTDAAELDLMRLLKSSLDPDGRMNPGKLV